MKPKQIKIVGALAGLLGAQALMNSAVVFPQWSKDYKPKDTLTKGTGLSPDQYIFALAGFREMIAGILWVRADSFFDSGAYDAVLPIIRLVTLLDPHQLDVYTTGMWHIGYNFTDEDQRSDRRYIPSSLALGKEGIKNNPETYELYFETGWIWYHKVQDDYDKAVTYFEQAVSKKDIQPARKNLLPKAYLRAGQVDKAIENYYTLQEQAEERFKNDNSFGNRQTKDTIIQNLDTELVRMVARGWQAQKNKTFESGDYDTKPPFDVHLTLKISVVDPRVLKVQGTWGVLPVGCRLKVILKDADYPGGRKAGMDWDGQNDVQLDPPRDRTYMQDELFIKNRKFLKTIDMSKDVTMYPLTGNDYVIEFYYNPRIAPAHIQDKFGYDGSGMTDSNFLSTDARPGQRVVYGFFKITKEQLQRRGEWSDKVPVFTTPGYKEQEASSQDDIVLVPSMRASEAGATPGPAPKQ